MPKIPGLIRVGIQPLFHTDMFCHCLLSACYSQIRVLLVQNQAIIHKNVHTLHSRTERGPLVGHRLGRRPSTTAALGQ